MKKWIFLIIIFIFAVLGVTILDYFKIFGVKPDLFLIMVIIASLSFELRSALALSIFAGILKDVFSPIHLGINTPLFALWSFLIIKLSKRISIYSNLIFAALTFIIIILNRIIIRLIFIFLNEYFISLGIFLRIVFLESLYTAAVSLLVFKVIKFIK